MMTKNLKNQIGGATLIVVAMTAVISVYVTSSVMSQINLTNQQGSMARDRMAVLMATPSIAQRIVTFRDRTPPSGGPCPSAGTPLVRRDINGISMCVPQENLVSSLSCLDHPWLQGEQVCFSLPGSTPTIPIGPQQPGQPDPEPPGQEQEP